MTEPAPGVGFVYEDDGRVTARHIESGVASFGESEADALRELADAIDCHFGRGYPIDDPEAHLPEDVADLVSERLETDREEYVPLYPEDDED